jgi:class 3 adenylate cyclase
MDLFRKLSVQSKLLIAILASSLLALLLAGYISYTGGKAALEGSILNNLTATRVKQAESIQDYFAFTEKNVLTLSEAPFVVDAFKEFKAAYRKLEQAKLTPAQQASLEKFYREVYLSRLPQSFAGTPTLEAFLPTQAAARYLQYHYIAANPNKVGSKELLDNPGDGSEYSRVHQKYQPLFRSIQGKFGYEDIILVDNESGNIIYTVSKEPEFATNLKVGPYAQTNLAEGFNKAANSGDPNFVTSIDFEPYRPSSGKPTAFFPTTLFDGNQFLGSLIFQAPTKRINQLMTFNRRWKDVGLGETGEVALIGPDNLLRSKPRQFVEDPEEYYTSLKQNDNASDAIIERIKQVGSPILIQKAKIDAAQKALEGSTGEISYQDYRGKQVLSSYQPVKLGQFNWALVAKQDVEEAFAPIGELTRRMLITGGLLIPAITLLSSLLAKRLVRPIYRLNESTRKIAQGETGIQVAVDTNDEFADLAHAFNAMSHETHAKEKSLEQKVRENDRLLLNILPAPVVKRLKAGDRDSADKFTNVTVLFAEIEGFYDLANQISPTRSVTLLSQLVEAFDLAAEKFGVEKLRTTGADYLAVSGLSIPRVDHVKRMVDFSQELLRVIVRFNKQYHLNLSLDIGIHTGSVVGGIVGKTKFIYELCGDTMTIAQAVHVSPERNVVQVTEPVRNALENYYTFAPVAAVQLKDKATTIPVWAVQTIAISQPAIPL